MNLRAAYSNKIHERRRKHIRNLSDPLYDREKASTCLQQISSLVLPPASVNMNQSKNLRVCKETKNGGKVGLTSSGNGPKVGATKEGCEAVNTFAQEISLTLKLWS